MIPTQNQKMDIYLYTNNLFKLIIFRYIYLDYLSNLKLFINLI